MKKAKAKERFTSACSMIWASRHSGQKIAIDKAIRKFNIGNNASKFLNRIEGTIDELTPDFFAQLFLEYSKFQKESNAVKCTNVDLEKFYVDFKEMCMAEIFPTFEEFSPRAILIAFLEKCQRCKVDAPTMAITAINAFIENANISQTSEREWVISMKR